VVACGCEIVASPGRVKPHGEVFYLQRKAAIETNVPKVTGYVDAK
jgi:hypothetical protein